MNAGVYFMNNSKWTTGILAALIFALLLAGCSSGEPKALAKKSYELRLQAPEAILDPEKTARLVKEAADIAVKVAKLSKIDQALYTAELARLASGDLGDLLKLAGSKAEDLKNSSDAAEAAKKVGDALKGLGF
jgi:predicted component of type VI protein secretion system